MSNSFGSISMMGNALRAYQSALEVTGHNIANSNTIGYSRQQIGYKAIPGQLTYGGASSYMVGNGVTISGVRRAREILTEQSMRQSTSDLAQFETLANNLNAIEGVFPEPGANGIGDALSKFFDSWSALAANPNDPGAKILVQNAGLTLTSRVREAYQALNSMEAEFKSQIDTSFDRIDVLSDQIASLNKEIASKKASGAEPSDLLDLRDQAVLELSSLIDVNATDLPDGTVSIQAGNFVLVSGIASNKIPRTYDPVTQELSSGTTRSTVGGGRLLGLMQSLNKAGTYKTSLDDLTNNLRTQINTIHQSGQTKSGATNVNFFNDANPQTGAINFALSDEVIASVDNIVVNNTGKAGDGGIALAIGKLREASVANLGGKTFKGYYGQFIAGVGSDSNYAKGQLATESAVQASIDARRQAESGVNLDEEMSNMLRFQRSYQAAAQALKVMDEVTQELVNMIR
ncbi:MAG: flagellar hook-associated protein FlgK [Fimbriimonadaceae bacterium]